MLTLGLDTSTLVAGLALVEDDKLITKYYYRIKTSLSQELLPSIDLFLRESRLNLHDIDSIAVTSGPGSFTGLRIGIATAKSMSFALRIPVFGVPTLEAMVYPLPDLPYPICPILDAKKQEVYAAVFKGGQGAKEKIISDMVVNPKELCRLIRNKTVFLGSGLEVYQELIEALLGELAIPWSMEPDLIAEGVALLGSQWFNDGFSSQLISLKPNYIRRSQAEIAWEERFK